MNYLIDTNIAYYISQISNNKNFNIEKFRNDTSEKFISYISILELYLKNSKVDFKRITGALWRNRIGIVEYGQHIHTNEQVSLKKLSTKPNSYIERIIKNYKQNYLYYISKDILYLGYSIGALYTALLSLKNSQIKLKDLNFDFISFNKNEDIVRQYIENDINEFFKKKTESEYNKIFTNVRYIVLICIASFLCKDLPESEKHEKELEKFNEIKNMDIDCFLLMQEVSSKRNFKKQDILKYYKLNFGTTNIEFEGLQNVVEYLFITNNLKWNDFADFIIISVAEKMDNCAIITADGPWQNFLKNISSSNEFANISYNVIKKFFYNI